MLEIIVLVLLAKKIGALAISKGLRPGPWKFRLVMFWLAAEFIGAFVGVLIFGSDNLFSCFMIAIAFAASSYFILNNYLSKLPDVLDDDINNIGRY